MNALRIERLAWAAIFAAVVAVGVALLLAPDPTGVISIVAGLVTFATVAPIAARFSLRSISPHAEPGDQTVRYAVFFAVALAGRLAFGRFGYDGFAASALTFAAAWLVAINADWLNPWRWNRGDAS
ncbi:hypothetical protein [Halobellus captivus]|uniref:hypothetical protein n=1 Tax=Halobellus captivus TaxID=2592614 RepID=UPI0011A6F25A|nr:hypothetical protein [Halobellus captivus]